MSDVYVQGSNKCMLCRFAPSCIDDGMLFQALTTALKQLPYAAGVLTLQYRAHAAAADSLAAQLPQFARCSSGIVLINRHRDKSMCAGVLIFRNTAPTLQLLTAWRLYLADPAHKTTTIGAQQLIERRGSHQSTGSDLTQCMQFCTHKHC